MSRRDTDKTSIQSHLRDEDLRVVDAVDRGVVVVRSLPDWRDTQIVGVPEATHACESKAGQHRPGTVCVNVGETL